MIFVLGDRVCNRNRPEVEGTVIGIWEPEWVEIRWDSTIFGPLPGTRESARFLRLVSRPSQHREVA